MVDRVDVGEYRRVTENGRLLTGDYLSIHDQREHSAAARDLQAAIDWGINKFWQGRMPNPQTLGNITGDW